MAEVNTVLDLAKSAEAYQRSGATIRTISAPGAISGEACENLTRISGVRASGALRDRDKTLALTALPASPVPLYEVTPGLVQVLGIRDVENAGVYLGAEAAKALDKHTGDTLISTSGPVKVGGRYDYPADGRRVGFSYAVLAPVSSPDPFDECWVDSWPPVADLDSLILTALVPQNDQGSENGMTLSRLNSRMGERFSGPDQFGTRITRYAAPVVGILTFSIAFAAVRLRRLELASALHARVMRRDLLLISAIETLSWSIPGALVSIASLLPVAGQAPPGDVFPTIILGLRIISVGVLGSMAGTMVAVLGVRERHLFRYFKDR